MTCQTFSRNTGPALIAWFFLITLTSLYLVFVCWEFSQDYSYVIIILHCCLIFYVVCTFGRATFMDPGYLPVGVPGEKMITIEKGSQRTAMYKWVEIRGMSTRLKWCITCEIYRPPRCSHCSICKHCIDTFDHHCPWLNNCIGRRNYRYFLVFLLSLTFHMIATFGISLAFVLMRLNNLTNFQVIIAIVLLVMVGLLLLPVLGLTGFHIFLVSKNRTTNEQVAINDTARSNQTIISNVLAQSLSTTTTAMGNALHQNTPLMDKQLVSYQLSLDRGAVQENSEMNFKRPQQNTISTDNRERLRGLAQSALAGDTARGNYIPVPNSNLGVGNTYQVDEKGSRADEFMQKGSGNSSYKLPNSAVILTPLEYHSGHVARSEAYKVQNLHHGKFSMAGDQSTPLLLSRNSDTNDAASINTQSRMHFVSKNGFDAVGDRIRHLNAGETAQSPPYGFTQSYGTSLYSQTKGSVLGRSSSRDFFVQTGSNEAASLFSLSIRPSSSSLSNIQEKTRVDTSTLYTPGIQTFQGLRPNVGLDRAIAQRPLLVDLPDSRSRSAGAVPIPDATAKLQAGFSTKYAHYSTPPTTLVSISLANTSCPKYSVKSSAPISLSHEMSPQFMHPSSLTTGHQSQKPRHTASQSKRSLVYKPFTAAPDKSAHVQISSSSQPFPGHTFVDSMGGQLPVVPPHGQKISSPGYLRGSDDQMKSNTSLPGGHSQPYMYSSLGFAFNGKPVQFTHNLSPGMLPVNPVSHGRADARQTPQHAHFHHSQSHSAIKPTNSRKSAPRRQSSSPQPPSLPPHYQQQMQQHQRGCHILPDSRHSVSVMPNAASTNHMIPTPREVGWPSGGPEQLEPGETVPSDGTFEISV